MRMTFWTALIVFLLDQASKYYIVHVLRLDLAYRIDVLPPYFNLVMGWNRGINFGLLHGTGPWLLIGVALAIVIWVWIWGTRGEKRPILRIAAGLVIGGALGNVIDRLIYDGAVADFINMSCCGYANPYSFNLADVFIFAGAFGLILFTGREKTP
jgi:signal peptidase II